MDSPDLIKGQSMEKSYNGMSYKARRSVVGIWPMSGGSNVVDRPLGGFSN